MERTGKLVGERDTGRDEPRLFDVWLQTSLRRLYDESLDQPVPEQLLDLLPEVEDIKTGG